MIKSVRFIRGGGQGAYEADMLLAASLKKEPGSAYDVRYSRMPLEIERFGFHWNGPRFIPNKSGLVGVRVAEQD